MALLANGPPLWPDPNLATSGEWVLWGLLTAAGVAAWGFGVLRLSKNSESARGVLGLIGGIGLVFAGWLVAVHVWGKPARDWQQRQREAATQQVGEAEAPGAGK